MYRRFALVMGLGLAFASASQAAVRAAKVFGDNMVLQQELPIAVLGWADAGEQVTVQLAGKSVEAKAGADGSWRVDLPAMKADGKTHALTIKGPGNTIEIKGVELGEVWLASGMLGVYTAPRTPTTQPTACPSPEAATRTRRTRISWPGDWPGSR